MKQPNDQRRILGLDVMRAAAITMVLVGHCSWIFPPSENVVMQLLAMSGYLGVEIFFVLSGFLIGNILYKMFTSSEFTLSSARAFLKRRWFRTLPNYYLILLINIIIAGYIGYDIDGLWRYFFFLQNFASPMLPFFTESWSLSIEEFAYLILPLALLVVARNRNKRIAYLAVILILWCLPIIGKFIYHQTTENHTIEQWNLAVKSVVIFRLDAILTGVLCSWLYVNYRRWWSASRHIWLFFGLVLMAFLVVGVGMFGLFIDRFPMFWNVIYLPLTSIAVACFVPVLSEWHSATAIVGKPITFVSKISYSMYLLHYGVILQLMRSHYDVTTASHGELLIFTLVYFLLTIITSWLLYRFYERPMMNLRDR